LVATPASSDSNFTVDGFRENSSSDVSGDAPAGEPFNPFHDTNDAGEVSNTSGAVHFTVVVSVSDLLLPGDHIAVNSMFSWVSCDGTSGEVSASATLDVSRALTGSPHPASYWKSQFDRAAKGKDKLDFSKDNLTKFLKIAAVHSGVFSYAPWNGVDPFGGNDSGSADIGSYADAAKVLKGQSKDSNKVRDAESEELALWLNVASGSLNPATALKIKPASDKGHDNDDEDENERDADNNNHNHNHDDHDGEKSSFEGHTGLSNLSANYDTVGEIQAFAAQQVIDWAGGHGSSKQDLKLSVLLSRAVNHGWLIPA